MKKFVLSEIMLLSTIEKKAKKVKFDKKRTLIYGGNGTGKSCLLKSIYKTFGATPVKDHPAWKQINPISLVRFEVDDQRYSILKDGKYYSIFDYKDKLIDVFQSVSTELGPFLADLFDFKIKLPNQQNELITPPPAFLFLPFYVDQDASWQSNWSGFAQLQQIKNFREPIVSYHTGLKSNEYYLTKGKIDQYNDIIKNLEDERKVLKNVLDKVKDKMTQVDFNINIEIFKEEIKELLVEDFVDCPTCGAHYENSFVERFEIAKDEDRCKELIMELIREQHEIDDHIGKKNSEYTRNNEEILKIEAILDKKKGEIKLRDVIENAGKNELKSVFEENSLTIIKSIHENALKQKDLQDRLKAYLDKNRREEIMDYYHKFMKKYLFELDVKTLKEESYNKIDTRIPETGSALPRALIAYYFSIFQVMKKYSTSSYCPIIIDSPNQQAQDLGHVDKILKFISENQPEDTQLILGIEELYDVDFNCEVVELNDKSGLLQKDEYKSVNDELDYYQTKTWNFGKGNSLF